MVSGSCRVVSQVSRAFAVCASERQVACACAQGVVRVFASHTLKYMGTLPLPAPVGQGEPLGKLVQLFWGTISPCTCQAQIHVIPPAKHLSPVPILFHLNVSTCILVGPYGGRGFCFPLHVYVITFELCVCVPNADLSLHSRAAADSEDYLYPDAIAITFTEDARTLSVVYSDHSLFVWDARDAVSEPVDPEHSARALFPRRARGSSLCLVAQG